jgi:hypothetical protein
MAWQHSTQAAPGKRGATHLLHSTGALLAVLAQSGVLRTVGLCLQHVFVALQWMHLLPHRPPEIAETTHAAAGHTLSARHPRMTGRAVGAPMISAVSRGAGSEDPASESVHARVAVGLVHHQLGAPLDLRGLALLLEQLLGLLGREPHRSGREHRGEELRVLLEELPRLGDVGPLELPRLESHVAGDGLGAQHVLHPRLAQALALRLGQLLRMLRTVPPSSSSSS